MQDYRFKPELFSNRAIVDIAVIENIGVLLGGTFDRPADLIVNLSSFVETIILNEKIVLTGNYSRGVFDSDDTHSTDTMDIVHMLSDSEIIENQAITIINNEVKTYHEIEVENEVNRLRNSGEGRAIVKFAYHHAPENPFEPKSTEEYIAGLYDIVSNSLPMPWNQVAEDHGIPYFSGPFYSSKALKQDAPTSISFELYEKLEQLNKEYFKKIRRYLGRTYVRLPSLLAIVLNECGSRYDLGRTIIEIRDDFEKFRKYCTSMEQNLRLSDTINDQIQIINEIELAYENTFNRFNKENEKSRIIYKTFDIVKSANPLKIGMNLLDVAKDYDIERQGLLKIPSYYDLWKASLDVKQSLNAIERLYGSSMANRVIKNINSEEWNF